MEKPLIEIKNLNKSFGKKIIFKNMNIDFNKGETIGIVGANGMGKSVFYKMLSGIMNYDDGEIKVDGKVIGKDIDFPEEIGILIDEPAFLPYDTGFNNLLYLAMIRKKIGKEEIKDIMNRLNLDPKNRTFVKKYSLGMKKKLALAQAIMEGQEIIILDEPFNALDFQTFEEIKKIINGLKKENKTVFITSHNQKDLEEFCDKIYVIDDYTLKPFTDDLKEKYFLH